MLEESRNIMEGKKKWLSENQGRWEVSPKVIPGKWSLKRQELALDQHTVFDCSENGPLKSTACFKQIALGLMNLYLIYKNRLNLPSNCLGNLWIVFVKASTSNEACKPPKSRLQKNATTAACANVVLQNIYNTKQILI